MKFTWKYLESELALAKSKGYEFITCLEYSILLKNNKLDTKKYIILRVDIDDSVLKFDRMLELFDNQAIKCSFFLRLHSPKYNPFSFENYKIIKTAIQQGHEIGYHSEIIDQSVIWEEPADVCLKRDLVVLQNMFDTEVYGIASHGGMTGLNNLDFWKTNSAESFGCIYEAYDDRDSFKLFNNSLYISDSEWTNWKSYTNGKLNGSDQSSIAEHIDKSNPNLIYLLIHPDTYFDNHIYELEG